MESAPAGALLLKADLEKFMTSKGRESKSKVYPAGTLVIVDASEELADLQEPVVGCELGDFTVAGKRYKDAEGVDYDVISFPGQAGYVAVCLKHDPLDAKGLQTGIVAREVLRKDSQP